MAEQVQFSRLYHWVLCTTTRYVHQYRRKFINAVPRDWPGPLHRTGGGLLELNGEPDDVHLRIALPPNLDLSAFVNTLKTTSSRLLRVFFGAKVY